MNILNKLKTTVFIYLTQKREREHSALYAKKCIFVLLQSIHFAVRNKITTNNFALARFLLTFAYLMVHTTFICV